MASVIVYTKDKCPGCKATMRSLTKKNIAFEALSIEDTPGARDMIKNLGYMQAPVVIAGDEHWSGYNPDRIEALAARLN
ncbi:MAG: glutaredoxin family protein [Enterococcus sp.]|nr:glutaredoxin family protein [Enterococcus sp.]